jgi:anti-sigma factor ChrR (cupin superfamily)
MSSNTSCHQADTVYGFAVGALDASEARTFAAHLATCAECRRDLDALRPVIASFVGWPSDVLRPSASLWQRLSERISSDTEGEVDSADVRPPRRSEWKEVSPGLSYKMLANDLATDRISMLVRLAPGVSYPAHRHSAREELHLLHGELMIDDRKLFAGDYYCAEPGTVDTRVWTATGCTCVLMASGRDELLAR